MAFPRKTLTLPSGRKLSISSTPAPTATKNNPSRVPLAEGGVVDINKSDQAREGKKIAQLVKDFAEEYRLTEAQAFEEIQYYYGNLS